MRFTSISVAVAALLVAGSAAETITVEVGKGGKKFSPNSVIAKEGDIVEFHFNSKHSVVAADFDNPCQPAAEGGFYSGSMGGSSFAVTIANTDPIFFYCGVGDHCQDGMVGVINQGSDSLDDFKSAAKKVDDTDTPDDAFGGEKAEEDAAGHVTAHAAAVAGLAVFVAGAIAL